MTDDARVGGGTFQTHFLGQKNPSIFDHFKRRSDEYNINKKRNNNGFILQSSPIRILPVPLTF